MKTASIMIAAGLAGVLAGGFSASPAIAQAASQQVPAAASVNETSDTASALLDAIEATDAGLATLTAAIQTTTEYAVQGDTETRRGTLAYASIDDGGDGTARQSGRDEPALRRFAVTFEQELVGDRLTEGEQRYIFDGSWVVTIEPDEKQFTSRQLVPPGERFDPLRLGEGPFPAPIGQRKADILERFRARAPERTEGLAEMYHAFAESKDLRQLLLTPREGTAAFDEYDAIRLWYRSFEAEPAPVLIPQIIRVIKPIGDESLVVLTDIKVNEPIDAKVFDTTPPPRGSNWNVSITPWRESTP